MCFDLSFTKQLLRLQRAAVPPALWATAEALFAAPLRSKHKPDHIGSTGDDFGDAVVREGLLLC